MSLDVFSCNVTASDDWLQKGCEVLGLSDMAMPDQLYLYMVGGQKRPMVIICISSMQQSVSDAVV